MLLLEDKMLKIAENIEKILPPVFAIYDDDDYSNAYDEIYDAIWEINDDFSIETGASKCVAYFPNADKVLKIPYAASLKVDYYYDEEDEEYDYDTIESEYFDYFSCNYCEREAEIYLNAKAEKLDFLFAKTEHITNNVYIQEKVKFWKKDAPSKDSLTKAKSLSSQYSWHIDKRWLADVIEAYGDYVAENLIEFVIDNDITDLHNGNCGYRLSDGKPVLSDYSGWND